MNPGEPTLPSVIAARALWAGEPGAWGKVLGSMLERSLLVAPALWLAGDRELGTLARKTALVVTFIEVGVLLTIRSQLEKESTP